MTTNVLFSGMITLCNFVVLTCCLVGDPLTSRPVWFTKSHLVLVIFFFTSVLFINFILDIKQWSAISS